MGMRIASIPDEHLRSSTGALLGMLRPGGGAAAAVSALAPQAWDDIVALAVQHNVAPLLQRALRAGDALTALPEPIRTRLEEERRITALDNLQNYGVFRRIAQALRERGVPVIALKGLHLAELVYRDISLRPMSDLDILVPQSQVELAVATLQSLEFELNKGLPTGYDVGLTHRRLDILVEVHWALGRATGSYSPPVEEVWRSAAAVRLADADVQVMSPEYLLLHVCAHLAYHHLFALDLRALCDIAEIVHAHPALDWAAVVDQGRRHGWGRGVAAALRLARDSFGVVVPEDVIMQIGGGPLDPERLTDAREQLETFAGIPYDLQFAPNLTALSSPVAWREKIATLWKRIFVPRTELAANYGVSEHSVRINLFYAIRLRDLIRRYAASARELKLSGPQLAASAARNARLEHWLNDS